MANVAKHVNPIRAEGDTENSVYTRYVEKRKESAVRNGKLCPEENFWDIILNEKEDTELLSIISEGCKNVL